MRIRSISLRAFRAHERLAVDFKPKVNVLYGPNGVGKTNVLEAIHYLCLSKSFLTSTDRFALRNKEPLFELEGAFTGRHRKSLDMRVCFHRRDGMRIFTNGALLERRLDLVGRLPVVSFAPGDISITAGPPLERRQFLNNILCQERPAYMEQLRRYRKILRQRNVMLTNARRRGIWSEGEMAAWNGVLVRHGSQLMARRAAFLAVFSDYMEQAYGHMSAIKEQPAVAYKASFKFPATPNQEAIEKAFHEKLELKAQQEREQCRTLVGPHRDDVRLSIDGLELRQFASQGQHRTVGIGIKLAQCFYLQDRLDEPPILLLDDVFDTLDTTRTEALISLLRSDVVGQSIITTAQEAAAKRIVDANDQSSQRVEVKKRARSAPSEPG